jgi:signal transduction histidine kinase/ActR/RegA family two-component response regulator
LSRLPTRFLADHPYLVAVAAMVVALALHYLLHRGFMAPFGVAPAFIFFFGAIALASWLGGLGPGLFATVLATVVADLLLFPPVGSIGGKSVSSDVLLAAFFLVGATICALFHLLRRSEENLRQSVETVEAKLERAEESNNLKRNFIANLSHEIRTPLSSILGFSDLLASGSLTPDERKNYLERLRQNALSLTDLVTDLLDVTEVDSAYFVANRRWVELQAFIQRAIKAFKPLALEKGLKLQVHYRGSLPAYVESDPEQLMQILHHVVGNAIRYTDHGLIEITVASSKGENERRELAFIVSDPGSGVPSHIKPTLFTQSGKGVGLKLARRLARGLGGDVKLLRSDRRGSTFLITIDAGQSNEAREFFERIADVPAKDTFSPDNPHALDGTKVLVIDDSADAALLVRRMLETIGAEVQTALRASEGIELALKSQPDAVLMDIEMPEIDGNEATRRLRELGFRRPIIALSAHVMKEDRERAAKAGVNDFLMKPLSRRALLEKLGDFLRSRGKSSRNRSVPQL